MYNLYARKREKPEFEFILPFSNIEQKFSIIDELDENTYEEAIIVGPNGCELYVEFKQKPKTLVKQINRRK